MTADRTIFDSAGSKVSNAIKPKTIEARPARTEPSDESNGGPVETGPRQGERNRPHAHDRQGENAEHHVAPPGVFEAGDQHGRAEEEPHQKRHRRPGPFGEAEAGLVALPVDRSEHHPSDEGSHEAACSCKDRGRVGQNCQTEDGKGREGGRVQAVLPGPHEKDGADSADANAKTRPTDEIDRRGGHRNRAMDGLGCRRPGDEEVDERCDDAVVQPALNVQQAPYSRWHPLVFHDGGSESGIGGRDDRGDGRGHPNPTTAKEPEGDGGARSDGQRQPDGQQANR